MAPPDPRAYLALLMYVPLSLAAFAVGKDRVKTILFVFFGGLLFLPELAAFDFPLLPPMDKNGFAAVMAFVGVLILERRKLKAAKPLRGVDLLFLAVIIGNVGTAYTNPDTLVFGQDLFTPTGEQWGFRRVLPPITPYDILSMTVRDVIGIYLPFLVARALLRTKEDAVKLFEVLAIYGLVYVPLMLFEMRMSPQLHRWIYGYMANAFGHSVRGSGFKPVVFLNNGLPVAMFMLAAILATAGLLKARRRVFGLPPGLVLGVLWVTHLLSRNVGANIYALVSVPLVLVSRGKMAGRLALALVILVITYPSLRATGTFPTTQMVEFAAQFSEQRAHSLNTRFVNEDALLERAQERIWYGWGGYGRNRIYNEYGRDVSITDGEWIIRLGGRGVIGFVGSFGLLLLPVLIARRRIKRIQDPLERKLLDALALVVALNVVDLLPNGLFTVMPLFLSGGLAGLAQGMSSMRRWPMPARTPDRRR